MTTALIRTPLRRLLNDSRGANMVEYMIVVGVVAVLALLTFKAFGTTIKNKIGEQNNVVKTNTDETSTAY